MLKVYPSKVLLFGEYTILTGSKAFAVPYDRFGGRWSFESSANDFGPENSRKVLYSFLKGHCPEWLNQKRLFEDLSKGLWFNSTIPHGHGVGSSGALVAALYDTYGIKDGDLIEKKKSLAILEDYFHGASSGLDPLVSLIQSPLLIHHFNEIEIYKKRMNLERFFLLNTQSPRQTGPLVFLYQEKMKNPQFKNACIDVLSQEVNLAITALLNDDSSSLFHQLWLISKFQWDFFPEMIPHNLKTLWSKGLDSGEYILKLCGAGGGGFILGYSDKLPSTDRNKVLESYQILEFA